MRTFLKGFKAMLPIMTGTVPFGAVMGSVCSEVDLSLYQTVVMNLIVFGGTSQLAAIDLMTENAPATVIIITGLIINLRFMLYSASLSPLFEKSNLLVKLFAGHHVTDQNYAAMMANESLLHSVSDKVRFYFGATVCMFFTWHLSVLAGFTFGNFAPASLSLDYAVPLSFVALVMPTLKNKTYIIIAVFSCICSIVLKGLPFNLGLIITGMLAILIGAFLTRKKEITHD